MPLAAASLSASMASIILPVPEPATTASMWEEAISQYAMTSVPALANPAAFRAAITGTISGNLLGIMAVPTGTPATFANALQTGLMAMWNLGIIAAGFPAVIVPPTLAGALVPILTTGSLDPVPAITVGKIATAIDVWSRTILYGPVAPPVTPLL